MTQWDGKIIKSFMKLHKVGIGQGNEDEDEDVNIEILENMDQYATNLGDISNHIIIC